MSVGTRVAANAYLVARLAGPGVGRARARCTPGRARNPDRRVPFAFSGKLTAFVGPFLLGLLTGLTGSQRVGVSAVLALFVVGLPLLLWVDEREGVETASRG
jgi:UMF1 family MFS transporter